MVSVSSEASLRACVVLLAICPSGNASPLYGTFADERGAAVDQLSESYGPLYVDEDFENGDGRNFGDFRYSKGGERGDSGYKTLNAFEKGIAGKFGANGRRRDYSDKGGRDTGHADGAKYYSDKHALVKGSNGGDFAASNSYNKGSRTTGFHNVHHKEEYKKNSKFYDESSKSGHYSRYGDFGAALLAAAGASANGHKYDKGFRDARFGETGFADKGALYNNLKQYAAANGYDGYYDKLSDFASRGGVDRGRVYGYKN